MNTDLCMQCNTLAIPSPISEGGAPVNAVLKIGHFARKFKTTLQSNISIPQGKESVFNLNIHNAENATNVGVRITT